MSTRWHYDDAGRVTHTTTDPAWNDHDRAMMAGFDLYRALRCPDCAEPIALAWHEEAHGWFEVDEVDGASCGAKVEHTKARKDLDRRTKLFTRNEMPVDMITRLLAAAAPGRPAASDV